MLGISVSSLDHFLGSPSLIVSAIPVPFLIS